MIVFSSDHGNYLGDHWMEKGVFHQQSVKVPLIIYDPRASADATRGVVNEYLVEGIDLLPTLVEACGGEVGGVALRVVHLRHCLSVRGLQAGERRFSANMIMRTSR